MSLILRRTTQVPTQHPVAIRRRQYAVRRLLLETSFGVTYRVLAGKREGRNHLEDPSVDGMIILRWIFRKWMRGGHGLD